MKHIVFVDSTVSGLLAFEAAKNMGHFVTFIRQSDASFLSISIKDESAIADRLRFVDQSYRIDSLNGGGFRALLERINAERRIDALLTTSEAAIVPVAREAEHFGLIYPAYDALRNAVHKDQLRDILKRNGIRSPSHLVLTEDQLLEGCVAGLELPYVIKPTRGFAKQFSAICFTEADVKHFIDGIRSSRLNSDPMINDLISRTYLIEEYVKGTLHSAEVILQNGTVQCYATTVRFRSNYSELLEMTTTMPSGLSVDERSEIKTYVQSVFDALDLKVGLFHVEFLRDSQGPVLVEINARMMGSLGPQLYRMITDIDPFALLINLHLGETIDIDDSVLTSGGTVVTIASRYGGEISIDYNHSKFASLLKKYDIGYCTANVGAGQRVSIYTGNIGTIGHAIVLHEDPYESARKGHRFLNDLDEVYGLELAKYFEEAGEGHEN